MFSLWRWCAVVVTDGSCAGAWNLDSFWVIGLRSRWRRWRSRRRRVRRWDGRRPYGRFWRWDGRRPYGRFWRPHGWSRRLWRSLWRIRWLWRPGYRGYGGYGGFGGYGLGLGYGYGVYGLGYGGYGLGYGGYGLGYGGYGLGYGGYGLGYGGLWRLRLSVLWLRWLWRLRRLWLSGLRLCRLRLSSRVERRRCFGYNSAYVAPTTTGTSTTAQRRYLGIDEEPMVGSDGSKAMKITNVYPGTAAEKAGLKAGDVLRSVNGYLTEQRGNLAWIIANATPNNQLKLNVQTAQDGKTHQIVASLP